METVYICYCGEVFIFDKWMEPTTDLYKYIHSLMEREAVEIRIIPHGCKNCLESFLDGKPNPHHISLPDL